MGREGGDEVRWDFFRGEERSWSASIPSLASSKTWPAAKILKSLSLPQGERYRAANSARYLSPCGRGYKIMILAKLSHRFCW